MRHNDRIISGKNRLKDIKNEINLMQFQSSIHINEMQTNVWNKFNFCIF